MNEPTVDPMSPNWMPSDWSDETALIRVAAARYCVDYAFIAAIRKAENGGKPSNAFGVLSLPLAQRDTYSKQLNLCCQTVVHRLADYEDNPLVIHNRPDGSRRLMYSARFIEHFASIWAPAGADNDPDSLNANWVFNATAAYYHQVGLE